MSCGLQQHDADIYQHVHLTLKSQLREYPTTARDDALILKVADGHSSVLSVDLTDNERLALRSRILTKTLTRRLIQLFGLPSSTSTSTMSRPITSVSSAIENGGRSSSTQSHALESQIEQRERLRAVVLKFNHWISTLRPPIQKIRATVVGTDMRLGVVATGTLHDCPLLNEMLPHLMVMIHLLTIHCTTIAEPLKPGEPYAAIPKKAIMDAASAYASDGLKSVFVELKLLYPQGDDFHALLFHLIWERYVCGYALS